MGTYNELDPHGAFTLSGGGMAVSGGAAAGGMSLGSLGMVIQLSSMISSASGAYHEAKIARSRQAVLQSQYAIDAESRSFDFKSSQLGMKASLLESAHNLTMQGFELKAAQYGMKVQAIQLEFNAEMDAMEDEFQASMSEINARTAEKEAVATLDSASQQIGWLGLKSGQIKEAFKTQTAGRGIVLGDGSAGEVAASIDLVKEIDAYTIKSNAVYAAGERRMAGVDSTNRASFAMQSASTARLSGKFASESARQQAALQGSLGDIRTASAAYTAGRAAGINANDVPNFVTRNPLLSSTVSPKTAGLTTLVAGGARVASSWYSKKLTLRQITEAIG